MYVVLPLMEKRLTQTGIWIRFDSALSDPALCTGLHPQVAPHRGLEYSCTLAPLPLNTNEAKDQEIRLPIFLWTVYGYGDVVNTEHMWKHGQILEWKIKDLKHNIE